MTVETHSRASVWLPKAPGFSVGPHVGGGDLLDFAEEQVSRHIGEYGALLFRGFDVDTPEKFSRLCDRISPDQPTFKEESSPRSQVTGAVYTSTEYDARYPIQFHTEYSYSREWPLRLFFGCLVAPESGGATPIADTRRVLAHLREATRKKFKEKNVLYVRNYLPRMGVSWQTAFNTTARADVEAYCREIGIECEWKSSESLTTRQLGPAIAVHPRTGEELWFNHAFFFNVRGLEPEELRETMLGEPEDELSTNTYYGDGSPIEDDVFDELRAAYERERLRFSWEKGDVLLIDNMMMAHSREPFAGPRRIVVTMTDLCRRDSLPLRSR